MPKSKRVGGFRPKKCETDDAYNSINSAFELFKATDTNWNMFRKNIIDFVIRDVLKRVEEMGGTDDDCFNGFVFGKLFASVSFLPTNT